MRRKPEGSRSVSSQEGGSLEPVKASPNPFRSSGAALIEAFKLNSAFEVADGMRGSMDGHQAIIAAIEAKDPAAARKLWPGRPTINIPLDRGC